MADNVGSDSNDLESITSSQKSYLQTCPFAGQEAFPTDSGNTEVLGTQISPAVVETPVLSFSSPTSLDSINEDIFRTPPENENASLSDSEHRVRVSEITSPSNNVSGSGSNSNSTADTKCLTDSVPPSSPPSDVRVTAKHPASDSASSSVNGCTRSLRFASAAYNGALKTPETIQNLGSVSETEDSGGVIPFKEIIEALLGNSGEKLNERDEDKSCVDILKRYGFNFP